MKRIFYVLICLAVLLSVGCNRNKVITVPDLKVSAKGSEILVSRGGYKWTNNANLLKKETVVADSASPTQIANTMSGNKVNPQSELVLNFSQKPNSVKVVPFGELKDNKFTYTNEKITVPKEKGTYIYEIVGNWSQGHVSYTVKVIVTNE